MLGEEKNSTISHLGSSEIALYVDDRGQLMPCDGISAERYAKMKRGKPYIFEYKQLRDYTFLKKYFSLLNLAFQNQDLFSSIEWFRYHTLIAIGHCDVYTDPFTGNVYSKPKSISFSRCTKYEFDEVYTRTLNYIIEKYGFDQSFVEEVLQYDG